MNKSKFDGRFSAPPSTDKRRSRLNTWSSGFNSVDIINSKYLEESLFESSTSFQSSIFDEEDNNSRKSRSSFAQGDTSEVRIEKPARHLVKKI